MPAGPVPIPPEKAQLLYFPYVAEEDPVVAQRRDMARQDSFQEIIGSSEAMAEPRHSEVLPTNSPAGNPGRVPPHGGHDKLPAVSSIMANHEIDYLERILKARVYGVAVRTPLVPAPLLSARLGSRLLLKREDEQRTFSFKIRGSYNKIAGLAPEELECGVVAASAGNHAQGVALAARELGTSALIVMPETTPRIKVDAVAALGARIELHGDSYDDAEALARELGEREGRVFVHAYDDPDTIAGQGTVGMEILEQHPDPLDAIFVPIGGGGLISGIAAYTKRLRPGIKVIGVEPADAAAMKASLDAGRRVRLDSVGGFADGVAVKRVGEETFRLCRQLVDEIVLVDTDEICAAIKDVFEDTRTILEPAGALSVAGVKSWLADGAHEGLDIVAIASGANMNFDRLRHVSERAEIGERREAILAVTIPERPGSLKKFCTLLGDRGITEFNYRYAGDDAARVFVGVAIRNRGEVEGLVETLTKAGFDVVDLGNNEIAKLHVRHMVGGRAESVANEVLFRFEFPERPGALTRFLDTMTHDWNISLFHYRNHGADYGRVLIGLQVPSDQRSDFAEFLDSLGYSYTDETDNAAYRLFLA
jgi:threonine dehydratase